MVIYKIENKIDGKIYVGQTQRTLEERMKEHLKKSCTVYGNSYIDRAIKKYGIEIFSVEIVEECETLDELNEREIFWIKFYNCKKPNGYNLTDGGEGTSGHIVTEETRKKISESHKGKNGRICSKETKAKISMANKGRIVSPEVRAILSAKHKGKKLSDSTKAKMAKSKKNKRIVRCIETGKIFESISTAAKWTNITSSTLSNALAGRILTAGGYHWEFVN